MADRPDPDQLLETVQREEEAQRRGKLKIFFGATAGVGKTYAMLSAAQEARRQGTDVSVGIAETHGRRETAALLEGLEILPLREQAHAQGTLKEFDLDAALRRRPTIILVDELAHSNIAGSRHPKRWQDVEELLQSGIHVYTTLNVQHLDSLNDVVGGITGIRVWETVPDRVFDRADDVVLVDLPPDELLKRLGEGKVYQPAQAQHALKNFFNKGNLIALRELALRRMADRVDADVRSFRSSRAIQRVWATGETVVVGIGGQRRPDHAVRAAARFAERLEAPWHAVYIETPDGADPQRQKRYQDALRLAQELGAETATVPGRDVPRTLVEYARSRNIAKILLGRAFEEEGRLSIKHFLPQVLKASTSRRIARLAPELDVIRLATDPAWGRHEEAAPQRPASPLPFRPGNYVVAGISSATITGLSTWLLPWFELTNIAMLFLLGVLVCALRLGRGPAVLAAFLNVAAFDFFFVPPRFTFAVSDVQYVTTFAVMLAVALITGYLTAGMRYQVRAAARREVRLRALYEMARDLSASLTREQVATTCDKFLGSGFQVRVLVLSPDDHRHLLPPPSSASIRPDLAVAQWAFDHAKPAGKGTDSLPGSPLLYLPLNAPMRTRGVLAVEPLGSDTALDSGSTRQLEAAAALIAIALERVHYVEVAQDALVRMESERLRNSLLSALSHDVRTPLTALVGLSDALAHSPKGLDAEQQELVAALREEAQRMNRLVNNLLDMARLAAGKLQPRMEWQSVEEAVGSSLRAMKTVLKDHRVVTAVPRELPLVRFDALLIERVLCNLLENAAKYAPRGSEIRISAVAGSTELEIGIQDQGPGFPPGKVESIFETFNRGEEESAVPGVGLGLSISRAIVEAHKGRIRAETSPTGGARFVFTLPLGKPPEVPSEASSEPPDLA